MSATFTFMDYFERKVRQEGKLQLQHANLTHKHLLKGELMLMELRALRTGCDCNVTFSCFFRVYMQELIQHKCCLSTIKIFTLFVKVTYNVSQWFCCSSGVKRWQYFSEQKKYSSVFVD